MGLLIHLLVIIIVFGAIWYALKLIPLPPPAAQIANLILVVLFVLVLLGFLTGYFPLFAYRP